MAIQLIINREWGLAKNENPNQGSLHHRRADRSGRGGGAEGVRGDQPSAAACSARWRPATSAARSRKSRCYYEQQQARRLVPDRRRQHLPQPARRRGAAEGRADPLDRGGEAVASSTRLRDFQRAPREARRRRCSQRLQQAVIARRERVRGADGRGARLLARPDHARAVRGRRAVPAQHVAVRRGGVRT